MKREEKSKHCSGQVTGKGGEIILYKAKDGRTRLDVRLMGPDQPILEVS